jgi:hypothetical protein
MMVGPAVILVGLAAIASRRRRQRGAPGPR